jgi:O-antigen ligase
MTMLFFDLPQRRFMFSFIRQPWLRHPTDRSVVILLLLCLFLLLGCRIADVGGHSSLVKLVHIAVFTSLCWVAFQRPVWGIIIVVAALPAERLLPHISFATSMYPLLGGASFFGYVLHHAVRKREKPVVTWSHLFAVLFLIWISISHPKIAFLATSRSWFMTFFQLVAFSLLVTQLIRTDRERTTLLSAFTATATVSALFAIPQVQYGLDSATSLRAIGLAGSPNSSGAYYTIGIIYLFYTSLTARRASVRLASIAGAVVLYVGLASTLSRTAFIALVLGVIVLSLTSPQDARGRKLQFIATLVFASMVSVPVAFWQIASGIFTSIFTGTDSIGFRYMQWESALQMWRDHLFAGVGIGQFKYNVFFYGVEFIPFYGTGYVAHNLMLALLAETGIIGTLLFTLMVFSAFLSLSQTLKENNPAQKHFRAMWLTVSLIALFRGITSDTHFEKLLWLVVGLHGSAIRLVVFDTALARVRSYGRDVRKRILQPAYTQLP